MAGVELRHATPETLPSGNSWEFSERNKEFKPLTYQQEYRDLSQASGILQRLVRGIQERYVQDGWNFAAAIGGYGNPILFKKEDGSYVSSRAADATFAIIFVNPDRTRSSRQCPPPDFLKPEMIVPDPYKFNKENEWRLLTDRVNELLRGTNLYAEDCFGAFNEFDVLSRGGWFVKKPRLETYYQTGVAAVRADLDSIQKLVTYDNRNILAQKRHFRIELRERRQKFQKELQESKQEFQEWMERLEDMKQRKLALQTPTPQSLFD